MVSETGRNRKNDSTSITFLPEGKHLDIKSGSTVLDATRKMGIDIQAPCGDLGLCGRCKIVLGKGKNLAELPTETEKKILSTKELDDGYRLACQCKVSEKGLLSVIVPPESKISQQRIVIQGIMPQFQ
ncbi:MAG: 2Fe-2S iron-sulfur cluster-binding protein, partial [Nitrososphaerales archaeon]|nr:2Fe-2S iron-sulfur cluster-binding protein [Nitrososphaerales archaeon]